MASLETHIEECLRSIHYHPTCAELADTHVNELIESAEKTNSVNAMRQEIYARATDAVLMKEKYFGPRVKFLSHLISYLQKRPEQNLAVAEDGCGTGVDLHVVSSLLKNKVSLTGIDTNQAALAIAKSRVPHAEFASDFPGTSFDVIYADYVSIDNNDVWDIAKRGEKSFHALRTPGVVLQNSDMQHLRMHILFFGKKFSKILPPELLGKIENGPDSHLCVFEK